MYVSTVLYRSEINYQPHLANFLTETEVHIVLTKSCNFITLDLKMMYCL